MDNKNFGQKLKNLRKSKGYTQQILAEQVGIDEKHLSRLENGKFFPTYNTLNKLLNVLGVNIAELGIELNNTGEINNNPIYAKCLQILNMANNKELKCYLDILKATQRALKLNK